MSIRLFLVAAASVMFAAACGGSGEPQPRPTPETSPTPAPSATPIAATPEPRTTLRIAYINLDSPFPLDPEDTSAADTFEERLANVIEELRELDPDIVAFADVSWSEEDGAAWSVLAAELKMEFQYARSAPWLPNQTKEESDELVAQLGWEEGLLLLSKEPILSADRHALPGRDSDVGLGEIVLHVSLAAPVAAGILHVFIAQLAEDDPELQLDQAQELRAFIDETAPDGSIVLLGSFGPAESTGVWVLQQQFTDLAEEFRGEFAFHTCCRENVLSIGGGLDVRADFIMTDGWLAEDIVAFGHLPQPRADGSALYVSVRNGLLAVLPMAE